MIKTKVAMHLGHKWVFSSRRKVTSSMPSWWSSSGKTFFLFLCEFCF